MDNFDEGPIEQPSDDDTDENSTLPVVSNPATSATPRSRSQRSSKGLKNPSMMGDLIVVVGQMAAAIKNPPPTGQRACMRKLWRLMVLIRKGLFRCLIFCSFMRLRQDDS
ncbi:hypothetical protein IHE45_17G070600 [Dioscorea alata]|uniref:Uncharacterized protein n=1 Tax=Dioscorea alata TaxID=55571 RepID=A0ACB7UD91_DIOAL|nr:hypothetical protein IHE45_17G070600 [Dioscorea alata]